MNRLGVGETLDTSLRIYRKQFGKLIGLSALVSIPSVLLVWILMAGTGVMTSDWLTNTLLMGRYGAGSLERVQPGFLAAIAGIGVVAGLLTSLAMAAISAVTFSAMRGKTISFGQSLGQAGRALPSLIVSGIVAGLLTGLGFVACIVPGLIVATCYALFVPAIVAEGTGPFASLGRSSRLTQGERWAVFGVMVVTFFIIAIITSAFSTVVTIVSRVMFGASLSLNLAARNLGSLIPSILLTPLSWIPLTVMFVKLRDAREASEFEYSVDRMLENNPDGSSDRTISH